MVGGREHEPEADVLDAARDRAGAQIDPGAERLEHVGRAGQAGGRAVAVLGDRAARAGGDQRGGRRDVERPPPAAGAGGVEQVVACDRRPARRAPRIVRARPASSSTVSPLVRSAIRNAAIWTSDALPAMISESTAAASSRLEVVPAGERVDRPREQFEAGLIACRARKLPSSSRPCSVRTDSGWNWTPSAGSSRWRTAITTSPPKALRSSTSGSVGLGDERVVAADLERVAQAAEDRPAVVLDHRRLAVDRLVRDDAPAQRLHERLVAEAHAEQSGSSASGNRRTASSEIPASFGVHGPGRDDHPVIAADQQLVDRRVVVADDLDLGAELAEVLDEVVGEAVVVVEDEDAHPRCDGTGSQRPAVAYGHSGWATASSIACSTARALASDSRNS